MKKKPPAKKTESSSHISFSTKEFVQHERNQFWYVGIGLLLVAVIYLAIIYKNYFFAAALMAAGIAIFRLAHLEPQSREVRLTDKGVHWGKDFFGYHKLRSFYLARAGEHSLIYFERLNFSPAISFPIFPIVTLIR